MIVELASTALQMLVSLRYEGTTYSGEQTADRCVFVSYPETYD